MIGIYKKRQLLPLRKESLTPGLNEVKDFLRTMTTNVGGTMCMFSGQGSQCIHKLPISQFIDGNNTEKEKKNMLSSEQLTHITTTSLLTTTNHNHRCNNIETMPVRTFGVAMA